MIALIQKLVDVHHDQPFTNTLVIAEGVELEHASVIKLVRKFKTDFEEFGPCRFQIDMATRKQGGGKPIEKDIQNYLIEQNHFHNFLLPYE